MSEPRILVVDDEARYIRLLQINLSSEGYEVIAATNGLEAIEAVTSKNPDLILLDIMMPKLDGFSTCERIRQFSGIPIIMLTARADEEDKVKCLNIGADDYITKPFSATEVLARVRAVLRRSAGSRDETPVNIFSNGRLRIDYGKAEAWLDDKPVSLTATEYRLLILFTHHLGKVVTADELLTTTWGPQYREDREILWVTIARLRQKLEINPKEPELIVTRSGLGYVMPQQTSSPE